MLGLLFWTLSLFGPALHAQPVNGEIGPYLEEIEALTDEALTASRAAEQAATPAEVKQQANVVFQTIWGLPSGLTAGGAEGDAPAHGWKTRWQTTPAAFDSAFAARYGTAPPEVTDPQQLGILGRGRHVRHQLQTLIDSTDASEAEKRSAARVITALNNVIGWMKMDDGVTKGERQPRVDLTREWDSPTEFWLSTADTGWLLEVYSQSLNILKTNYGDDVEAAREHAAAMTQLIEKALNGVDANNDGTIEAAKMEGGLQVALQEASSAGFMAAR